MKEEARVKNADERKKGFEEKQLEKVRRKEEKKAERKKREDVDNSEEEGHKKRHVDVTGNIQEESSGSGEPGSGGRGEKRKAEDGEDMQVEALDIIEEETAVNWVCEVKEALEDEKEDFEEGLAEDKAWDDINGCELNPMEVQTARKEEVTYMKTRPIWTVRPRSECWEKLGKAPVSVRWVDSMKSTGVRSRLVARDFKGNDKDRDDLFAATPPLEAKRLLFSQAATRINGKGRRKLLFIDAKKAHLNPKCEDDVYIELPAEAGGGPEDCGKLSFWLYGFRPAAHAWEHHYSKSWKRAGSREEMLVALSFIMKNEIYLAWRLWRRFEVDYEDDGKLVRNQGGCCFRRRRE